MAPIRTKAAALQTPPQAHYSNATNAGQAPAIPSIRLISATPSATGMSSSEGTTSNTSMSLLDGPTNTNGRPVMPWDLDPPPLPTSTQTSATLAKSISNSTSASNSGTKKLRTVRSVLKPKVNDENAGVGVQGSAKKVVVPKKSKLGLLGTLGGKDRERERGKDLSDVVRRVGVGKLDGSTRLATVSLNNGSSVTLERGPSSATAPNAPSLPRASTTATMKKTPAGTVSRRAADGKASSAKLKAGFEIYVDPSFEDEEIGEIVVVKKKKSRAGLDGVGWGAPPAGADKPVPPVPRSTLGERNMNIPAAGGEDGMLKVKEDERKWWSIGRGRKDSKEDKKKDNEKATIAPRSQTPEPFGGFNSSNTSPQKAEGRGRFNSLDAGIFLGLTSKKSTANFNPSSSPTTTAETPTIRINDLPEREAPASIGRERSKSVTLGGLLAVPGSTGSVRGANTNASNTGSVRSLGGQGQAGSVSAVPPSVARSMSTGSGSGSGGLAVPVDPHMPSGGASGGGGSIALRAMRSVKSLARIGSWAQLGSGGGEGVSVRGGSKLRGELDPSLFVAPDDAGTTTATSNANANANGAKKEKRKSKKETKEEKRERKEREKEEKMREKESRERALSTSSFEAGALSSYGASPAPVRCATSLGFNGSPASYGSVRGTSPTAYASIRERAQSSLGFHVNGGGVDDGGVSPTSTLGFATAGSPRGYTITDSNAPIGYDANTGSLTVGKVKGKKKKAYLAGGAGAGVGTGETTTIGKSATIGRSTGKDTIGKASSNNKDKDTIGKKKSILGLGLPSSIRLPSLGNRQGSSASSVVSNPGMQFGGMVVPPAAGRLSVEGGRASVDANGRLSVEGLGAVGVERRASVQSTASSLRPVSVASSYGSRVSSFGASSVADSRLSAVDSTGRLSAVSGVDSTGRLSVASGVDSTGRLSVDSRATKLSTGAGSVRWSEGVLEREKEKEERRRESLEAAQHANASYSVLEEREGYAVVDRKDGSGVGVGGGKRESLESRRESRESRRSSEGRRRAALTDVFPEVESQIRATSGRSRSVQPEFIYDSSVDQSISAPVPSANANATPKHNGTTPKAFDSPAALGLADDDPFAPPPGTKVNSGVATATSPSKQRPSEDSARTPAAGLSPTDNKTPSKGHRSSTSGGGRDIRHTIQVEYDEPKSARRSDDKRRDRSGSQGQPSQASAQPNGVLPNVQNGQPATRERRPSHGGATKPLPPQPVAPSAYKPPPTPATPKGSSHQQPSATPVKAASGGDVPTVNVSSPPQTPSFHQLSHPKDKDKDASSQNSASSKRGHKKGKSSIDKIGLGKIFGSGNSAPAPPVPPLNGSEHNLQSPSAPSSRVPSESQGSASSLQAPQEPAPPKDGKKSRRNTLTVMVEPFIGTIRNRKGRPPTTPATAEPVPTAQTPVNATHPPVPSSATVPALPTAPHDADLTHPDIPVEDGPGLSASSNKAKKVMQWFRTKSKGRESVGIGLGGEAEHHDSLSTPITEQKYKKGFSASSSTVNQTSTPASAMSPQVVVTQAQQATTPKTPKVSAPGHPQRAASSATETPSFVARFRNSVTVGGGSHSHSSKHSNQPGGQLRIHQGAVDQTTITTRPPPEVMAKVKAVLEGMGVEIQLESEYKYRCIRHKKKKGATSAAGTAPNGAPANLAAVQVTGSAASNGVDRRGLPLPSPSAFSATGGMLRGLLMRRQSSQVSSSSQPSLAFDDETSVVVSEPLLMSDITYGDPSQDAGDEVRFSVELTRIDRLNDTYSLDIRRLKGNLRSYKYLYDTIRQRADLQR